MQELLQSLSLYNLVYHPLFALQGRLLDLQFCFLIQAHWVTPAVSNICGTMYTI